MENSLWYKKPASAWAEALLVGNGGNGRERRVGEAEKI